MAQFNSHKQEATSVILSYQNSDVVIKSGHKVYLTNTLTSCKITHKQVKQQMFPDACTSRVV